MKISQNQIAKLLISSSPEGILIVNQQGEILIVNDALIDMFGYDSEKELIGQQMEILIPKKYKGDHTHNRENYHKNPSKRRMGTDKVLFGRKKNNEEIAVEIGLNHIKTDEGLIISALITDITERIEIQDKLKTLNKELENKVSERTKELENAILELQETYNSLENQYEKTISAEKDAKKALEKEKELGELKSRFVSMASHEFRTPLSTVLSSNSLISKYLDKSNLDISSKEKIEKHTARINNSVKNLNEILNDLLSLGKIEEGKIKLNITCFSITKLLDEIKEEINVSLKDAQVLNITHSGKEQVKTDKHLLHNVLLNLASNASKYSKIGSEIKIVSELDKNLLFIKVIDYGIGVPKEDCQYMFDRFFRAKNVTNIQGTGLGLNIVKNYVELMNGNITFTSELNKGSIFSIKITL